MARIRTVKPEFFAHEELGALPFAARLLAIGLMQLADSEGRLRWVPKQIEAHVFPWDDVDLDELASGLEGAGFLVRYEVDGRRFGALPNFCKHQRLSGKEAGMGSALPEYSPSASRGSNWENPSASRPEHKQERADRGEAPERFPGKHLGAQEQGTGNREQGTGSSRARGVPLRASTEWEEVGAPAAPPGVEDRACALWRRLLSSSDHMQLQRQLHGRPLEQYRPPAGQLEPLVRLCQEHTDAELAPAIAKATAADKPRAYLLSMVGADGRLKMEPRPPRRGKPYREQESRYTSDLSSLVFAEEAK